MADDLFAIVKTLDPDLDLKYNKFYIGLAKDGRVDPYVLVWGADGLVGAVGAVLFWRLLKN